MMVKFLITIVLITLPSVKVIGQVFNSTYNSDSKLSRIVVNWHKGDSVVFNEFGKVFAFKALDNNLFFYRVFAQTKPETDIGTNYLKCRDVKGNLVWEINLGNIELLCYGEKHLILTDFTDSKLRLYSIESGKLERIIDLGSKYILNDGCQCESIKSSTYLKYTKLDDFRTDEVIVIDNSTYKHSIIGLDTNDYYLLKKSIDGDYIFLLKDDKLYKFLNTKPRSGVIEYFNDKGVVVSLKF